MRRAIAQLVVAAVALVTVGVAAAPGVARATPAPLVPRPGSAVTADALPTVQVDGVVWSQAIVGNTVYAGGSFANARPAGAAPGTNLVPRSNLLAFDIRTGELVPSFAPQLNGQVLAVAASPDGSRIYVTGDFTTANGQTRTRLAAYDTATGQLDALFAPRGLNSQGRALAVTDDTVYVGGGFAGSGMTARNNLLAVRAFDGAMLQWDPNADYTVSALALAEDGSAIFAGGSFQNVGGQPAYGLAKIDATTGGLLTWNATQHVRNGGVNAGVTSLRVADGHVYGTAYHFGAGGNIEGPFKVSATTGDLAWAADCHGDTYSSAESNGVVYVVGHSHYCGNVGGGFPQPSGWNYQRGIAFTTAATGTNLHEPYGYASWFGRPSPSIVHWLPLIAQGTYTGQNQGPWNVVATDEYVVLGGEFPTVNSTGQQGLVRFGRASVAPNAQRPLLTGGTWAPTLVPTSTTSVRVSWKTAADRDDQALTYKVIRDGAWGSPAFQTTIDSNWWNLPTGGFEDTGRTPGATYRYQVVVNDLSGNTVFSNSAVVTMPTSWSETAHAAGVRSADPTIYWPLNDSSGPILAAHGVNDGVPGTSLSYSEPGMDASTGVRLDGTSNSRIAAGGTESAPDVFTAQAWIKTSTTSGGRILGFGDLRTGNSGHRDRHIYMRNDGRLAFGIWAAGGRTSIASANPYNDNAWHQVTATLGPNGMQLYVDGVRVASRTDLTSADAYLGYWRVGGDNLDGWPNRPTRNDFTGSVDEVAIYPTVLTQKQIDAQWQASGRATLLPPAPVDAYGAAVYDDDPVLYWRLGETSGAMATDSSRSLSPGTYRGTGWTFGQTGAITGTTNKAARSAGSNGTFISSNSSYAAPQVYSLEAWFKSTSTQGGKLIGFGNNQSNNSSTTDRHIYMQNDGKLVFGIQHGSQYTITTAAPYNDGQWHHVVGAQSETGMKLYVDGLPVGANAQATAQAYNGYWRVGGDTTWGSTSRFLNGTIDEVAVYPTALSAARVAQHFALGGGVNANQPPTAAFTSSRVFLLASFDGRGSVDPNGSISGYAWNFGDGSTGSGATPSHTYAVAGTYTVTLTVTDNAGATDTISRPVTVVANQAPTATFTSSADGLSAAFDGSASSDAEGPIVRFDWDFGDGTTGRGATVSHTYAASGTYTVTLTVTDEAGATGIVRRDVTVLFNQAPTATFTSSNSFLAASFDGSASTDADGTVKTYEWQFGDGSTGTGPTAAHTYAAAGTYTVTLTVTDDIGATGTFSRDITVAAAPNQPPSAAFTASNVFLAATFDGSSSTDVDGSIVRHDWEFGDGSTGTGATASHTYAAAGTYTVTLTVTDREGATGATSHDITVVANQPPTAAFTFSTEFLAASFDGAGSSDLDGQVTGYAWDFGDNTSGTGATAAHTYAAAGTYTVTLTITDDSGATGTVTREVSVQAQAVVAADRFTRTVVNGLGTAETGGAWTNASPASSYAVSDGRGSMTVNSLGGSASAYLNTASAANVDAVVDLSYDKVATGGGFYTSLVVRRIGTSDYRVKIRIMPTGTQVYLARTVSGVETILASGVVPGTFSTGSVLRVRLRAVGTGTTTLNAKAWYTTSAEPAAWTLTTTDTTAALQNPGAVGIYTYVSASATNVPVRTYIDDLWVGAL